ncbi:unnamed protein product [Dicrocoelium dendriticum]|nr:unnamed protein product [Dicrocoelium dendriticum]
MSLIIPIIFQCFAAGAESGVHSKSHPYILKLGTPTGLFNSWCFWNHDEELKLLDAIETYGFGNWWVLWCQFIDPSEDCKRHYETYYVNGLIGKRLSSESVYRFRIQDHTYFENHSTDFTLDLLKLEDQKILGYMPYRDEFECEYLNNAEKTLIAIPYDTTDELLRELHLALVAIYNRHLAYRRFRHSVACEHGLVPRLLHKIKLTLPKVRNWHRKTTLRSSQKVVRRPSLLSYGGQTHAYTLFKEATSIDSPSTMKVSSFELQSPSSELSSDRKSTFDYVQSNFECIKSTNDAYPHFSTTFRDPRESPPDELNEQPYGCDSLGFNQASWLPSLLLNRSLSSKCGLLANANPCLCSKHRTHAVFCYTTINCLTTCQGDSSTTTSDSGIGSCETCTHSILSISGDHLAHTSHSINLLRRPIQFRRSRCNSDSICFLSSRHRSERRSSGPNSPVAMRHRIENINDATTPFEPIPRTSDIKPDLPTKLLAQAGVCDALAAPPARRRGRPPKSSKRFPVRSAKRVSIPFKQRNLPLT